jgi:transcriptional regulator with XRE-family HTH domain
MTQGQLAEVLRKSLSTVKHIEHGNVRFQARLLEQIARALHCSVAELHRPLDAPLPRMRLRHHHFFSRVIEEPPENVEGTSFATPMIARRLAELLS